MIVEVGRSGGERRASRREAVGPGHFEVHVGQGHRATHGQAIILKISSSIAAIGAVIGAAEFKGEAGRSERRSGAQRGATRDIQLADGSQARSASVAGSHNAASRIVAGDGQ